MRLVPAFLLLLPACALAQAGSSPRPVPGFSAQVAPFPVSDTAGQPYPQPFLGGYDVPRPQLVDIDGDGDLDLFLQERSGELMFFERDGGTWTWRTDRFHDLAIGEWFRFVDLDGDALPDLLSELPYSHIRAWRNTGTRQAPRFTLWADSLRGADGVPIFADRQNILNVVDVDCNGLLDLFIGKVEGIIDRYESVGPDANGLPRFALVARRWEGIEIIGADPTMPSRPTRHGANTMAFGDVDGDGDVDLLWGDFFEPGLLLIANEGPACGSPMFQGTPRRFPVGDPVSTSGYNAPTLGDLDGDGDLDLVMGVIGGAFNPRTTATLNLLLMEQVAPSEWALRTRRIVHTVDVGSESVPALADLDGDGDLDLMVGSKITPDGSASLITRFENVGTLTAPSFVERGELAARFEYQSAPAVGDLDGDGLPDLLVGSWRDRLQWWRNTGTRTAPAWTLADSAVVTITRGSNTVPALGDLDGDGDLDLVIGEASGVLNLYRNTGTRTAPAFELLSDEFQGIDVGRRSAPVLVDLDGDGRLDLVIGSEDGVITAWRNVTTGGELRFEELAGFQVRTDGYAAPALGDLDGDGQLDLIVGALSGGLRYFRGGR